MKKTRKKAKGIEEKIRRIEFYDRLKNPAPPEPPEMVSAQDLLKRIRAAKKTLSSKKSAYNAGPGGAAATMYDKIRARWKGV